MSNETEKLTINLGVVDLAQVDVLVEQGLYANRSDLIRTAIRKQLETHKEDIERSLTPIGSKKKWEWMVGIGGIDKTVLEEWAEEGNEKMNISAVGMFIVPKNISVELFEQTIARVIVRGKTVASDEIKEAIKRMNEA
ncbi:MAG: hypothetical protein FWC72_07420 [Oscillospiraceae bacterium]|nr:hypothetical protein [Oscillospiraceae bacterium]